MTLDLADVMLVLSLLFVRPVPDRRWPTRLLLHTILLAACLATAALTARAPVPGRCLIGLLAAIAGIAVFGWAGRRWPLTATAAPAAFRLAGGLLLVGLALGLMHSPGPHEAPADLLAAVLGMLLTGLLAALAASSRRARSGALLLAGNGLLLAACVLPGMGVMAGASLLPIEAGLLWVLLRPAVADASPPA